MLWESRAGRRGRRGWGRSLEPRGSEGAGEDLLSLVGEGRRGSCPQWGHAEEGEGSRGHISPPEVFFPSSPAVMTGAGLRLRRRVVLATMVAVIFPATSSPALSLTWLQLSPQGAVGIFSLPGCLELVVGVGSKGWLCVWLCGRRLDEGRGPLLDGGRPVIPDLLGPFPRGYPCCPLGLWLL